MKKVLFIFAVLLSSLTSAQTDSTSSKSTDLTPYVAAGISIPNTGDFNNDSYASAEFGAMFGDNASAAFVIGRNNLGKPSGDKESMQDYWYEVKMAMSYPLGYVSGYGVFGMGTYINNDRVFIEYGLGISKEFGNVGAFLQVSSWDGIVYMTPGFSYSF